MCWMISGPGMIEAKRVSQNNLKGCLSIMSLPAQLCLRIFPSCGFWPKSCTFIIFFPMSLAYWQEPFWTSSSTIDGLSDILRGAYNCLHPPFRKGGKGGFETWEIPLNPPLLKGDFKPSQKQVWGKRSIRCKLFSAPLSKKNSGV